MQNKTKWDLLAPKLFLCVSVTASITLTYPSLSYYATQHMTTPKAGCH